MPETVHVFIGAGPANLHRALEIQAHSRKARLIFFDKRLNLQEPFFDRDIARANIFRFDQDTITEKMIQAGIDRSKLARVAYNRTFVENEGFQYGDNTVFSEKPFTQIQIRDLQELLMQTIVNRGGGLLVRVHGGVHIINDNLSLSSIDAESKETRLATDAEISKRVREKLTRDVLIHNDDKIHVHLASGALNQTQADVIIYNTKVDTPGNSGLSPDLASHSLTPTHGTVTFFINRPNRQISLHELESNLKSLDDAPWHTPLQAFGWRVVRPPRVRIFFANDILYIGAELPQALANIQDKAEYEKRLTEYTRTIAKLSFPELKNRIEQLPENPNLKTRFNTSRGESGLVITHTKDATIFRHGDQRYLPHYQTGSGFVTAFLINELYAGIYQHQEFRSLYEWSKNQGYLGDSPLSLEAMQDKYRHKSSYAKQIKNEATQNGNFAFFRSLPGFSDGGKVALDVFKDDLYITQSREIIESNKDKVATYYDAINRQELHAIAREITALLEIYVRHHRSTFSINMCKGVDRRLIVLKLLTSDNLEYLREIMPKIINKDFNVHHMSDEDVIRLRDAQLENYERVMPNSEASSPLLTEKNFTHAPELSSLFRLSRKGYIAIGRKHLEAARSIYPKRNDESFALVIQMQHELGSNHNKFIYYLDRGIYGAGWIIDIDALNKPENGVERQIMRNMLEIISLYRKSIDSKDLDDCFKGLGDAIYQVRVNETLKTLATSSLETEHFGTKAGEKDSPRSDDLKEMQQHLWQIALKDAVAHDREGHPRSISQPNRSA